LYTVETNIARQAGKVVFKPENVPHKSWKLGTPVTEILKAEIQFTWIRRERNNAKDLFTLAVRPDLRGVVQSYR
jgi:hypothetical protein